MFTGFKDKKGNPAVINTAQITAVIRRNLSIGEVWQVYVGATRVDITPQVAQELIDAALSLVEFEDAQGCRCGATRDAIEGITCQPPHRGQPERWILVTCTHWIHITAGEAARLTRLLTEA